MQSPPNRLDRAGRRPAAKTRPAQPSSSPRVPSLGHQRAMDETLGDRLIPTPPPPPPARSSPSPALPPAESLRRRPSLALADPAERPLSAQKYKVLPNIAPQERRQVDKQGQQIDRQKQQIDKQQTHEFLSLAIRTPDGARHQCRYAPDTPLGAVCADMRDLLDEDCAGLEVVSPADRVTYGEADMKRSLRQLGIADRSLLVLQKTHYE